MEKQKVQALRTIAGDYGLANEGDVVEVSASVAKELVEKGLAKNTSAAVTKAQSESDGVTVKDSTTKAAPVKVQQGSNVTKQVPAKETTTKLATSKKSGNGKRNG